MFMLGKIDGKLETIDGKLETIVEAQVAHSLQLQDHENRITRVETDRQSKLSDFEKALIKIDELSEELVRLHTVIATLRTVVRVTWAVVATIMVAFGAACLRFVGSV